MAVPTAVTNAIADLDAKLTALAAAQTAEQQANAAAMAASQATHAAMQAGYAALQTAEMTIQQWASPSFHRHTWPIGPLPAPAPLVAATQGPAATAAAAAPPLQPNTVAPPNT